MRDTGEKMGRSDTDQIVFGDDGRKAAVNKLDVLQAAQRELIALESKAGQMWDRAKKQRRFRA